MSLVIREYIPADRSAFEALAGRDLPDLDSPLAVVKLIAEFHGDPMLVLLGRATVEVHMGVNHNAGKPRDRWAAYLEMDAAAQRRLTGSGYEDAHLHLLDDLPSRRGYVRRIEALGWRAEANAWWKRLKGDST